MGIAYREDINMSVRRGGGGGATKFRLLLTPLSPIPQYLQS